MRNHVGFDQPARSAGAGRRRVETSPRRGEPHSGESQAPEVRSTIRVSGERAVGPVIPPSITVHALFYLRPLTHMDVVNAVELPEQCMPLSRASMHFIHHIGLFTLYIVMKNPTRT